MWSLFAQGKPGHFLYCHRPHAARLHYLHHSLDLLTGQKTRGGARAFMETLAGLPLDGTFMRPKVLHLSFELGYLWNGNAERVPSHLPLAVEIDYLEACSVRLSDLWPNAFTTPRLRFLQVPSLDWYKDAFQSVQQELLDGNCYQLNLTSPFYLGWEHHYLPSDFIRTLWHDPRHVGAYAHATWFSTMGKLLLSNSPECLVQRKSLPRGEWELYSMPIKGTLPLTEKDDFNEAWQRMRSSTKEEGELNMITDLVRNDLSRIARPGARVKALRRPLRVPGLLHQYSLVTCPVPGMTSWGRILECLFPGGSVTGAPKKNVLGYIQHLEKEPRGFYCGSTWLAFGKTLAASINIRTAELDMSIREMKYGAGGGITLKSQLEGEFEEMMRKSESFLSPFLEAKSKVAAK